MLRFRAALTSGVRPSPMRDHTQQMPIYRCNQCGFICEESTVAINTQTPCARCSTLSTVYGTAVYVEALIKRLAATTQELQQLKAQGALPASAAIPVNAIAAAPAPATATAIGAPEQALHRWFAERKIDAQFDPSLYDTSGFFDDTALQIGDGYALFDRLMERIRLAYRKSHTVITLELAQLSQKEIKALTDLCRHLYEHTFLSGYRYQKQEKIARLTLQSAPAIRQFFEGIWLEWYALMAVQKLHQAQPLQASARGVKVVFPNEDLHELDVVCLPLDNTPICIECKSGEFRRDIDKYLRLRKRLDIPRNRFVILSPELTQEQAAGFNAMYELSFVNLAMLKPHLQSLL